MKNLLEAIKILSDLIKAIIWPLIIVGGIVYFSVSKEELFPLVNKLILKF